MHAEVVRVFRIEAAHRLPHVPADHPCRRMQGHSYVVDVHVAGPLRETGWVVDFRVLNEVDGLANPTTFRGA